MIFTNLLSISFNPPTNSLISIDNSGGINNDAVTTIIKSIADQGATIVISAIVILFFGIYLRNVLKRENELVYGIRPQLSEINSSINKLQKSFNDSINAHNTRTNQSMSTVEKNTDDIKDSISNETELMLSSPP